VATHISTTKTSYYKDGPRNESDAAPLLPYMEDATQHACVRVRIARTWLGAECAAQRGGDIGHHRRPHEVHGEGLVEVSGVVDVTVLCQGRCVGL
jgi:hypothetical protein